MITLDRLVPVSAEIIRSSPNHDERPQLVRAVECVVLHATADQGRESGAEDWLCDARSGVSAHLLFRRDGTVVRLVPDERRAWHAGWSRWKDRGNVNDFSLGWEVANRNDGAERYTEDQYHALARAAAHYMRCGLSIEAFVSHASIARPRGRKSDPAAFDWHRFRGNALALTCAADEHASRTATT